MAKGHRRSRAGYQPRRVDTREIRQRFLIVCEGKRTEPAYFESFRTPHVVVRVDDGSSDPVRLVDEAHDRWQRARGDYDQVWCVFDRDDVPIERFIGALQEAKKYGISVAYSNPAFELWFLLHFQACGGAISRETYRQRLSRHLERQYRKNDPRLYDVLESRLPDALERAAHLLAGYDPCRPAEDDPSTTVHRLVQELLQHGRR